MQDVKKKSFESLRNFLHVFKIECLEASKGEVVMYIVEEGPKWAASEPLLKLTPQAPAQHIGECSKAALAGLNLINVFDLLIQVAFVLRLHPKRP